MKTLLVLLPALLQAADTLPPSANRPTDFARDIEPILRARCYGCHGQGLQSSGLRLDAAEAARKGGYAGPAYMPGDSAASRLVQRIAAVNGATPMPPVGKRLTPEEIGLVRAWIDQGAIRPDSTAFATSKPTSSHWAFQSFSRPPEPAVKKAAWTRNAIDRFILARLEKDGFAPSPEADRRTLLRRVSLDIIGLPPTREETAAFLADTAPDAYERQVERLLQSPHYGEKWARHWLDQARYADSDGYEKDWFRPYAWRYRDWVISSINSDLPFDRFTILQLAGDLLPGATADQRAATGFHRNALTNREGGVSQEQFQFETTLDRASTVASVWLGLTAGCAQCHDHKYDPISQRDMYSLYAFFDNVEESDIDAPVPGEIGPWLRTNAEYQAKRTALLREYKVPELQAEWEPNMLDALHNPGKRTDWDLAVSVLETLTVGGDGAKILQVLPDKRTPREADVLVDHFVKNYNYGVGPKRFAEVKFKELDGKLDALRARYPQLTQAMTIAESRDRHATYLRVRGDYKTNGIEVAPVTPAFLPAMKPAGPSATRLDLARWLVSRENPLTSRVAVNRIWQEFFGQGIVKTSEDFGTRGDTPSHPELLNWLASEFIDKGWSMKQMVREIATSSTYRQSSLARPGLDVADPANRLLARQSRLRLSAELIRDSALTASGLLYPKIGGPSVRPPQPQGVMELRYAFGANNKWEDEKGPDRYRRGLYTFFLRTTPYPQLMNFDGPKSNVPACRRERSNTPLQALNLLNDPAFLEAAQALAVRAISEGGLTFDTRLNFTFEIGLGRPASARERINFNAYFEKQRRILSDEPESIAKLVPLVPAGTTSLEAAVWTALASVLLNADEFITRQ